MNDPEKENDSRVVNPLAHHNDGKVRANIWLKKEMWDSVNDIAKEEDISASTVVRNALKDHIRKYKSNVRRK